MRSETKPPWHSMRQQLTKQPPESSNSVTACYGQRSEVARSPAALTRTTLSDIVENGRSGLFLRRFW